MKRISLFCTLAVLFSFVALSSLTNANEPSVSAVPVKGKVALKETAPKKANPEGKYAQDANDLNSTLASLKEEKQKLSDEVSKLEGAAKDVQDRNSIPWWTPTLLQENDFVPPPGDGSNGPSGSEGAVNPCGPVISTFPDCVESCVECVDCCFCRPVLRCRVFARLFGRRCR